MENNIHSGHRDRLRQDFLQHGFDHNTPPHKILELLLCYCVSRIDTNPIAHEMIAKYGSVAGVLDAPLEELAAFRGMSERAALLLKMIMPISRRYLYDKAEQKPTFTNIDQIGEYIFRHYIGQRQEKIGVMCLDAKGKMLSFKFFAEGDLSSVGLSLRELAKITLDAGATAAVLCHNHPDGLALPSDSDIKLTVETASTLSKIGVQLIDHIIVGDTDFVSMSQSQKYGYIFAV
ncbi:MAG: JAB domain-containing protein [Clostridia bacterium]|nr:JAB domain-containing protein [Clostridia bacterium]